MRVPTLTRALCAAAASLLAAWPITPIGASAQEPNRLSNGQPAKAAAASIPKVGPKDSNNSALLSFDEQIAPLLASRCGECHGEKVKEASLDLRSKTAMLKGGDSGPSLVPGSAAKSLLFERLAAGQMPPDDKPKLAAAQLALIKQWIDTGAHGGDATAAPLDAAKLAEPVPNFQPLRRPALPVVHGQDRARTPIDLFVLQKLEAQQLAFSPPADKHVLLRRLYLDLIGLPPSPAETAAFLADSSPGAIDRVLDRLLESPQFGERWGRHWLDAAGYADVIGTDNDAGIVKVAKGKWRYRDYVIESLNEDKPYGDFLTEQLAGDELVDWRGVQKLTPEMKRLLVATSFLSMTADNTDEKELRTPFTMATVLQGTGEMLASNLLGLTLRCAKCHNHKYEPITQSDYYSFLALFAPVYNPQRWLSPLERALPELSKPEREAIEKHNAAIDAEIKKLNQRLIELAEPFRQRLFAEKLAKVPEPVRADLKAALDVPEAKRGPVEKYLIEKFGRDVHIRPAELRAAHGDPERKAAEDLERQIAAAEARRQEGGVLNAAYDVGPPSPTYLLKRGQLETPGPEAAPQFLSAFSGGQMPRDLHAVGATSGRRLALAKALTDWKSPAGSLVARVMVNRVWQHLLGRGIIETTDNLGRSGTPASHPELLEWLSSEYVAGGARLKPLIRLIVSSAAYQQASTVGRTPVAIRAATIDPENHLWWRMPLRRMESEIVRDAILATSGKLDARVGGPSVSMAARHDGIYVFDKLSNPADALRRSLYLLARRNYHPPLLSVFDQPLMATNSPLRQSSTVVLQSLTMLNDAFVVEQSGAFASRVEQVAGQSASEAADRVKLAFRIALTREPTPDEASQSAELVEHHKARYAALGQTSQAAAHQSLSELCRMLLNTSEFLYIP